MLVLGLGSVLSLVLALPAAAQTDCADCHEWDTEAYETSVHGFFDCTDCHAEHDEDSHPEEDLSVDCSGCHDDVVQDLSESIHGREAHPEEAPDCQDCHGPTHTIRSASDEGSPLHGSRLAETCANCHADPEIVSKFKIPIAKPFESYEQSVHARAISDGGKAASCNDCHGSHAVFRASDPRSSVFPLRVSETCGQCHAETAAIYGASVHGEAAARGARGAPLCTDCHGEHMILSPPDKDSPVYATNIPKMICGRCHSDLQMAQKFDIPANRVQSYEKSFHGLAGRSGRTTVAHCGSCHGVHDVLPSSNPQSHVHPDNLAATCGQCHPGAGTRFEIGTVHVLPTEREFSTIFWVRSIYLVLIYGTIGGMVVHNLLDLYRKARARPLVPSVLERLPQPSPPRMLLGFRLAHALMAVSFIVLSYTGFALTYPEAWWASPLVAWEDRWNVRGWLHRAAAIGMLAALALHVAHLAVSRHARACIARMRPRMADLTEFGHQMSYYIGRRKTPPQPPDLGYPEKAEYLALMWGCLVMAATGFLLWFDDLALRWLPKWTTDLATVIHFYEAVLAGLAIIVWHLYFVLFDPVIYPMDTSWLTGKTPQGRLLERRGPTKSAPRHSPPGGGRGSAKRTARPTDRS